MWKKDILEEVKKVDYAFLDATFFQDGEVNRSMSEIPHPFIVETLKLFKNESFEIKNKIHFIILIIQIVQKKSCNRIVKAIGTYNFSQFGDQLSL